MRKIVLILEYDGTRYHGFQLQADQPTIQGEVEVALAKITGEKTRLMAASRTDAGVHARGQVVSFRTGASLSPATFISGLNHYLPDDVAVKAAYPVTDSFNVRREAIRRHYTYRIFNSATRSPLKPVTSYHVATPLDIQAINLAASSLVGRHDFASFVTLNGAKMENTVRTVYRAEASVEGAMVSFDMTANSFLPHQVRNTVGALIRVGTSGLSIDQFHSLIETKTPGLAGPTAPAEGLCLIGIEYPGPFGEGL